MAIPVDPTVTSIVTQALKRAGRTNPTAAQITEATDHALQEVKADIMLVADTHPNLLFTATTVTTRGQQRYAFPNDYNKPGSVVLMDGPDEWRGTVQTASSSTITFPSTLNAVDTDLVGKYVLITDGTGIEEYREIVSYNNTTRQATLDLPWVSVPTPTSTYLIVTSYYSLYPSDTMMDHDKILTSTTLGRPEMASEFGQEYLLYPVPDKSTYGILNRYYVDMSKVDETDALFIQLLREWRSLWVQGIAVKSMQRFDEDRYQSELQVYNFMLTALGNQTATVRPGHFKDI